MTKFGTGAQDEAVEMKIAQPFLELIKAPWLATWSQPTFVRCMRDRQQYEEKNEKRCTTTGEVQEIVVVSVKSSIKMRIIHPPAHYVFKIDVFNVTEKHLISEIKRKAGRS
ncbi:hypothetical protein CCR75_001461 [Bremia lactucae]|uniref:Uncharacterized protein n=1 Tax=Bremia lactucae TaxID=4779 RepID=A0A976IM77_BRELC|nr:hypothetical protein CCR75_001461 [Bremia lactucae]